MPAVLMLLPPTPLLVKYAYWLSATAIWMLAGLWPLNIATHTAAMVSHYQPCLLVLFLTIGHTFWCGALLPAVPADVVLHLGHIFWCGTSLSAMPVGVVSHYRSCLLVWCLTVGHAFWCGASLQAVTDCVVLHYRPCLLVRWHINQHFTIRVQVEEGWLQFCCYSYRCAITPDIAANPVTLSDMPA